MTWYLLYIYYSITLPLHLFKTTEVKLKVSLVPLSLNCNKTHRRLYGEVNNLKYVLFNSFCSPIEKIYFQRLLRIYFEMLSKKGIYILYIWSLGPTDFILKTKVQITNINTSQFKMAAPIKTSTLQENLKISTFDITENEEKLKWISDLNYMTHSVGINFILIKCLLKSCGL